MQVSPATKSPVVRFGQESAGHCLRIPGGGSYVCFGITLVGIEARKSGVTGLRLWRSFSMF